jgi:hypothetical protein
LQLGLSLGKICLSRLQLYITDDIFLNKRLQLIDFYLCCIYRGLCCGNCRFCGTDTGFGSSGVFGQDIGLQTE